MQQLAVTDMSKTHELMGDLTQRNKNEILRKIRLAAQQ